MNNIAPVLDTLVPESGIDTHKDLFEQGLNSISIVKLIGKVREKYGVDVDVEQFLQKPSLDSLEELIQEKLAESSDEDDVRRVSISSDSSLLEILIQFIGKRDLEPDVDLFEQGLTSLSMMELLVKVRERFDVDIELDQLLEQPTLTHLQDMVSADMSSDFFGDNSSVPSNKKTLSAGVLSSKAEKDKFKQARRTVRSIEPEADPIEGECMSSQEFQSFYELRRSSRQFNAGSTAKEELLGWLSCLNSKKIEGDCKFLYPSAGGTYSIQVYVEIKPGRVDGMPFGVYYYDPRHASLTKVGTTAPSKTDHFYYNRTSYESAHFCLFFVVDLSAIEPLYKTHSESFASVEVGSMLQLLSQRQRNFGLGSCPMAGVSQDPAARLLGLDSRQKVLLSLFGGTVNVDEQPNIENHQFEPDSSANIDIAIVGLHGQFPGAKNIPEFWSNLVEQRVHFSTPRDGRWAGDQFGDLLAGYADSVAEFDRDFFGLDESSYSEMDFQQRCFLRCIYELLDEAGYNGKNRDILGREVGVFAGVMWSDPEAASDDVNQQIGVNRKAPLSTIANRVSWFFNWTGPSIAIDTSCSSSLTSVYLACQAIAKGDCRTAVAGGINLISHPSHILKLREKGLASSEKMTHVFGENATGMIPGEGVGAVLLKRLEVAEKNRDNIWGVIKGGSLSHAGRVPSFGMPSTQRQADLIRKTLRTSKLDSQDVQYVEAAAAGSALSDATEVQAIQSVFSERETPLLVGSLKSNIGHLESASGLSQIAKVLLQMKYEKMVPGVVPGKISPLINPDAGSIEFVSNEAPWCKNNHKPLRALVNSFGATGSYANLLIESYQDTRSTTDPIAEEISSQPRIFVLSSNSEDNLRSCALKWKVFLEDLVDSGDDQKARVEEVLAICQLGRDHRDERLAICFDGFPSLISLLGSYIEGKPLGGVFCGSIVSSNRTSEQNPNHTYTVGQAEGLATAFVQGIWEDWSEFYSSGMATKLPAPSSYPASRSTSFESVGVGELPTERANLTPTSSNRSDRPRQPLESEVSKDWIGKSLRGELGRLLGSSPKDLDIDENLFQLGIDSAAAVSLVRYIQSTFDIQLPVSVILEHGSIGKLETYLLQNLTDKIPRSTKSPKSVPKTLEIVVPTLENFSFPLSEGQKGLWVLQRNHPDSVALNCPFALRFESTIDAIKLQSAMDLLVSENPMLTSQLSGSTETPDELVCKNPQIKIVWRDMTVGTDSASIERAIEEVSKKPFDLRTDQLLRCEIIALPAGGSIVVLVAHHILADGQSIAPLVCRLFEIYRQFIDGVQPENRQVEDDWADFLYMESQKTGGTNLTEHLDYWGMILAGAPASTVFPADAPRTKNTFLKGTTHSIALPSNVLDKVREMCSNHSVLAPSVYLAAFFCVIHRFTGQSDMVVGMPTNANIGRKADGGVGYQVYPIPVRAKLSTEHSFIALVRQIQECSLEGLIHSLPFPLLVRHLGLSAAVSEASIFQMAYVYQKGGAPNAARRVDRILGPDFGTELIERVSQEGEYELMLEVVEGERGTTLNIKFNQNIYRHSSILRVGDQLCRVLDHAAGSPDAELGDLVPLDEAERLQVVDEWNQTNVDFGASQCIHEIFDEKAKSFPNRVALSVEGQQLTYKELSTKSDQLAHCLQQIDVVPGTLVGLCMDRSIEMVVGLLGILKAGGAYIPIEPTYPKDRVSYILEDSEAPIVVTSRIHEEFLSRYKGKLVFLNASSTQLNATRARPSTKEITPQNLCYVLYTSGSTGKPKGCMLSHSAVVNRIKWMQAKYRLDESDRVLQKTPFSFDVSVWEFFWPLMTGAKLVLAKPEGHKDPAYLVETICKENITTCHFVPSMLSSFIQYDRVSSCKSLRTVFTSGEALSYHLFEQATSSLPAKLHNLYGPTEAAIDVTYWEGEERSDKKIPIGKPISNIQIYIVDHKIRPVPIGASGELLIGGAGLADGYLNRDGLSKEKFISNPFDATGQSRLYRTGDTARWLADGNIEFLGRVDNQVKIRGFRIELGEIDEALLSHDSIDECVVISHTPSEQELPFLVAYVVQDRAAQMGVSEFKGHLRKTLPDYMVPAYFVSLDELPKTNNGKLNRAELPNPKVSMVSDVKPIAPTTDLERSLEEIWLDVLELESVGVNQSFFDLGGHSLTVVSLLARVSEKFGATSIEENAFYDDPTIGGLARQLQSDEVVSSNYLVPLSGKSGRNAEDRLTLVCVPFAGATASIYRPFARSLSNFAPDIDVVALTNPANRIGNREGGATSFEALAEVSVREIVDTISGKIAVYGHCIGSYLALEIVRRLESMNRPVEFIVVAAAFPLPRIVRYLPFDDRWKFKSDESLWAELQHWGMSRDTADVKAVTEIISRFRRDAKMAYGYEKARGNWKINAPLVNLLSKQDPLTANKTRQTRRWKKCAHTADMFEIEKGSHYFIEDQASLVAEFIGAKYSRRSGQTLAPSAMGTRIVSGETR